MNKIFRGIDHVAMTVPNMEEATTFFKNAFKAKINYDLQNPENGILEGEEIEEMLGLKKNTKLLHMRMLTIGSGISLELFQYDFDEQKSAAISSDIGLQHFAVYVDDIDEAARLFTEAGGKLFSKINRIFGPIEGTDDRNRFVYGKTPWGTIIELVTIPGGINYPDYSEIARNIP